MKRVEIDPKTIEETRVEEKKDVVRPEVSVAVEKPKTHDVGSETVSMPKMLPPNAVVPQEKPMVSAASLIPDDHLQNMGKTPPSTTAIAIAEKTDAPFSLPEPKDSKVQQDSGPRIGEATAGSGEKFSNLDDLLAGSAKVTSQTAPILMPTDLLFEYNSSILRSDAEQSLAKLGDLIKKNSQAIFRIEGHTDSFGSDEYNDLLSLKRAEAVKEWLLQHAGLDAKNMTTAGLGKRHLLVPPTGSVAQQQLNRRVEIVITTQ
jgi:outer membrane protein OmpA-like peptidoglycan-associated protein